MRPIHVGWVLVFLVAALVGEYLAGGARMAIGGAVMLVVILGASVAIGAVRWDEE